MLFLTYKTKVLLKLLRHYKAMSSIASPILFFLFTGVIIYIFRFVSKRKHLLATLLSLEGLILFIFCLIYFSSSSFHGMFSFNLVFVTLTACEGALGLSLLVTIVRSHGGDQFNSLNFLQC